MLDDNMVIGEVTLYCNPEVKYEFGNLEDLLFEVGGAYKPSIALFPSLVNDDSVDVWSGPTGNVPGAIDNDQLLNAQICYYGKEPQHPHPQMGNNRPSESRKYLVLNIRNSGSPSPSPSPSPINAPLQAQSQEPVANRYVHVQQKHKAMSQQQSRHAKMMANKRAVLKPVVRYAQRSLSGDVLLDGRVFVVLKVYPKYVH
jgi:hypothetical protein